MAGKLSAPKMMSASKQLFLQTPTATLSTAFSKRLPYLPMQMRTFQQSRNISSKTLTPSLTFLTNGSTKDLVKGQPDLSNYSSEGRPLTILLCWLMAKEKAVRKYSEFYLDQGFDVLTVRITPGQLLLPAKAEPIIQNEILPTLMTSDHGQKLIHGFSVGGYVFGRMLMHLESDPNGQELSRTIKGQVWDSVVDVNGTSIGVSKSVFPNSPRLQLGLQNYIDFHMKVLYEIATKYYHSSHKYFVHKPLNAPSLFLCSEVDPISTVQDIRACQKEWLKRGISCEDKFWKNTGHVGHMKAYPEEYKATIRNFIEKNGLDSSGGRIVNKRIPAANLQSHVIPEGSLSYFA